MFGAIQITSCGLEGNGKEMLASCRRGVVVPPSALDVIPPEWLLMEMLSRSWVDKSQQSREGDDLRSHFDLFFACGVQLTVEL